MTNHTATSINLGSPLKLSPPGRGRRIEQCMGTVFSFDIRQPGCDPAVVDNAIAWLHWVDDTFSTYKTHSPISRLARSEIDIAQCPPEVEQILTRCHELQTETDGYFSAHASGRLDPSGLVKGWAIQHVSDLLRAAGSRNHCINGGGDVHCAGSAADGEPWRIGISDPTRPGQLAAVLTGTDIAVATSGTAERGAHIGNPHDLTAPTELASVTIVGKDLASTDAYATAAFAMGSAAPDWVATLDGYQGLVIQADGSQWASDNFATNS